IAEAGGRRLVDECGLSDHVSHGSCPTIQGVVNARHEAEAFGTRAGARMRQAALLVLAGLTAAGCSRSSPPPAPDGATDKPAAAVAQLKVGMSEAEVRALMKPFAMDSGVVYWGGTGARRVYFAVNRTSQVWVEVGPGPEGRVVEVGPVEPKGRWERHEGDSITVR